MTIKSVMVFAWAWIIIVGGLMITPGGVACIACVTSFGKGIAVMSIVFGALGLVNQLRGSAVAQR